MIASSFVAASAARPPVTGQHTVSHDPTLTAAFRRVVELGECDLFDDLPHMWPHLMAATNVVAARRSEAAFVMNSAVLTVEARASQSNPEPLELFVREELADRAVVQARLDPILVLDFNSTQHFDSLTSWHPKPGRTHRRDCQDGR